MSVTMCRVRTHPGIYRHGQKTTDKINLFPQRKAAKIKDGRMTAGRSVLLLTGYNSESFFCCGGGFRGQIKVRRLNAAGTCSG